MTAKRPYRDEMQWDQVRQILRKDTGKAFDAECVEALQKAAHDLVVKPLQPPAGIFLFGIQANSADPFDIDFEDTAGHGVRLLPSH